jgi:nonsense-mediated mRNA decay protein 3
VMSGFSFPGQMPAAFGGVGAGAGGGPAPVLMPKMLCCQCGAAIDHNPTSMCAQCLATRVDVTEGITTQLVVHRCRGCERWLKPGWVVAELESAELMAVCLKKVRPRL